MKGFDVNCLLGHWPFRKIRKNTFEDLRSVHAENDISTGLVSSLNSIFYNDPFEGDSELFNIIKSSGYKQILTVNPLLPGYENDIKEGMKLFDIIGVRVYPGYHGYDLTDRHFKELCDILAAYDLPIFLTIRLEDERLEYIIEHRSAKLEMLAGFLSDHTKLTIILLTIRNEELIHIKDILCSSPNIYYDTSGLKNQLFAIEKITDALGAKNLLYGSLHPLFCLKSTQLLVSKAEISPRAKKDIFYENARGLFGL